jgi:hypothetical protein
MTDSNRRPSRCKRDALPTELIAREQALPPEDLVRETAKKHEVGCPWEQPTL